MQCQVQSTIGGVELSAMHLSPFPQTCIGLVEQTVSASPSLAEEPGDDWVVNFMALAAGKPPDTV